MYHIFFSLQWQKWTFLSTSNHACRQSSTPWASFRKLKRGSGFNNKQIQKRKKKKLFSLSCSQTLKPFFCSLFVTVSLAPLPSYKDGRYCTIDPFSHLLLLLCSHLFCVSETLQYFCFVGQLCKCINVQTCAHLKRKKKKRGWFEPNHVWKAVWQRVHTEKKCKKWRWCKGCSCPMSITDWHGPLIFYGLGVKWGNRGYRKEGR